MTITSHVESVAIFFAAFLITIPYASLFEWLLHRYIMHKAPKMGRWKFEYAFKAHAGVHHGTFRADKSYHLQHEKDKHLIPMAWWNGALLIALGLIPFIVICHFVGHTISILSGAIVGCSLYYATYEFMHWCMHNPLIKQRLIERFVFFRKLNGHHILHHRYTNRNFNVVLPLWDWILRTLLRRSPISFPQVRGLSVPDVQPK